MSDKRVPIKEPRYCPYCDAEIAEASFPYCKSCEVEIFSCPVCRKPVPRDKQTCPHCGADMKEEAAKKG